MVPDKKPSGLGTELHREVLLDLKARATSDGRSAITVSEPDNPQVLVFRHIAGRTWEKVTGVDASTPSGVRRRALSFITRALNALNPNSRSRGRQGGNRR